jgi:hypothetical protein
MKFSFILFITAFALGANAQKVSINWGEESKKELSFYELVRGDKTDLIKLSFDSKGGGLFSKPTLTPIFPATIKPLMNRVCGSSL